MSPLAGDATGLDLMTRLRLPAVLVGGSYLGGISHTLTAIEALAARRLAIGAVVVSQSGDPDAPDLAETVEMTRRFAGDLPVIAAPRAGGEAWADALLHRILSAPA
jgi:dethiobiotin synthetase